MMKSFIQSIFIKVLLFSTLIGYGQAWNPIGGGVPGNWPSTLTHNEVHLESQNGSLYLAYSKMPGGGLIEINIERWNGLTWTSYPPIQGQNLELLDFVVSGSSLYVFVFDPVDSTSFFEFNGTSWIPRKPPGYFGLSLTSEIINGELIVGGAFTANGGINNIYKYTTSGFIALPAASAGVIDIHGFGGDIYISEQVSSSTTSPNGLLKLQGPSWAYAASYFTQGTSTIKNSFKIFDYQNDLYVADTRTVNWSMIYKLGTDTLEWVADVPFGFGDICEYNNEMYLSGSNITAQPNIVTFDGSSVSPLMPTPGGVFALNSYNGSLCAASVENGSWNGINYNHVLSTSLGSSALSGTTYFDGNLDCFFNTTESVIPNTIIGISGITTSSGSNGEYSIRVLPGSYSLDTAYVPNVVSKNLISPCALPSTVSVGANQQISQDIGFANTTAVDMQTTFNAFAGWGARYGFTEVYKIDVSNAGNTTAAVTDVTIDVPSSVNVVNITPMPSSINGNSLTFSLLNVQPLETKKIFITAEIDTGKNSLGDTLIWLSTMGPTVGDSDLSDNADTLIQLVTGAYDPNDKQASATQIAPGTDKIDYHIRFQNTGTDTAYKVTVVDTLDLSLPITRIVINSASHPYSLSVVNNILIWEFDNIMLPDSGADYLGSQGYVRFSAGIDASLGVGDTIDNDAEIYFDYQHPVHTNHAKTAIVKNVSLPEFYSKVDGLQVYPNPSSDVLYIKNVTDESIEVQLIAATGKVVRKLKLVGNGEETLEVNSLAKGVYFVKSKVGSFKVLVQD